MTSNYISIKSVLFELSLTIEERYWNETTMLEWASRAIRQMNLELALEQVPVVLQVCEHKAQLPSDLKYLTQVMYKVSSSEGMTLQEVEADLALPQTSELLTSTGVVSNWKWAAMRLSTSPFHNSICLDEKILHCADCKYEFSVSPSLVLTTNMRNGTIMVAYLRYPVDEDGLPLIPDNEVVKEAILHYVLYRYWTSKYQMKEDGADGRVKFHLDMWSTLSKKALNLNLPDVSTIENLMNIRNRIVPRGRRFAQGFATLANQEYVNY